MAVTPVGNPYVESSDNVADFPGASEALAERIDIVGVNPFANAAARDAAIPSPVQGQMCSLNDDNKGYRYDGSAWVLFSGAGDANFTNASTGTYTDGGINYKYITFTASGELIVDQAGFADVLCIGGGGAGNSDNSNTSVSGAGGGSGGIIEENYYLTAATHTITIGAGGAGAIDSRSTTSGIASQFGTIISAPGGGRGGGYNSGVAFAFPGGSGGGGTGTTYNGGQPGALPYGYGGGDGTGGNGAGGGGGGGGGVGSDGSSNVGGTGGVGRSSSLDGTATFRGGGGGGGGLTGGTAGTGGGGTGGTAPTAGTANTGGGGGGDNQLVTTPANLNGGSGIVIIRVVV